MLASYGLTGPWSLSLTVDVRVECVLPLLFAQLQDTRLRQLVGVVVEQDVDGAHLLQCLLDRLLAVVLVFEVGREEIALLTVFLHVALRLLGILLLFWQIDDEAVCTLHGEENSSCLANATVAARDQSLLALELAGGSVQLVASIFGWDLFGCWLRVELLLQAWCVLSTDRDLMP